MKTAISIMLALFIMGCSGESSKEAQNVEPKEVAGEMSGDAQTQNDEAADQEESEKQVAQETDSAAEEGTAESESDEASADETTQPKE
jgi:hypothetical protein